MGPGSMFRQIWRYRDLLSVLVSAILKLIYKQTALGAIWVVAQPLVAAVIFAVVFGRNPQNFPATARRIYCCFFAENRLGTRSLPGAATRRDQPRAQLSTCLQKFTFPSCFVTGTDTGKKEVQSCFTVDRMNGSAFFLTPCRVLRSKTARNTLSQPCPIQIAAALFLIREFWSHKNHVGILRADENSLKVKGQFAPAVVFTGSNQGERKSISATRADAAAGTTQAFFLGHVLRPALRALYQNALVLCYSSFPGPLNLPPLEAFALGCPVIAADITGTKEQFGDAAILVNPADDLQIACALRSLSG